MRSAPPIHSNMPPRPRRGGAPRSIAAEDRSATRFATSRVARSALVLACLTAALALASAASWGLGWVSEREMVFPLVLCLGGSVLAGTVASIGWMHAQRRRDDGIDRAGIRLSLVAGVLALSTLVLVTLGLDRIDSEHAVRTHVSPAETLGR